MHRTLKLAVIGALLVAGSVSAQAQVTALSEQGRPTIERRAQRPPPRPLFTIFGLPVVINTPVPPPYCNCAFRTVGGQPASGQDVAIGRVSSPDW
jgi:hypothetical protein